MDQANNQTSALDRAIIFASGSSAGGDVRGFATAGFAVGASAPHFHEAGIQEALALAETEMPFFLDNGAFEEWNVKTGLPRVDAKGREMLVTDAQWRDRLAIYQRLADSYSEKLYCVAPDKVGSQEETLERLRSYAGEMQAIAEAGANIMVSLHGGALSRLDFYWEAAKVLGFAPMPAFPIPAGITDQEVLEVIKALKPRRAHLLGLGAMQDRAHTLLEMIAEASPKTAMSIDSCRIGAVVGIVTRKDGSVRLKPYTKAQYEEWDETIGEGVITDPSFGIHLDRTELWGNLDSWLPKDKKLRSALCTPWTKYWNLPEDKAASFIRDFVSDPDEAFSSRCWSNDEEEAELWSERQTDQVIWWELEQAMSGFIKEETAIGRKARCLAKVFGNELGSGRYPAAMQVAKTRRVSWMERLEWERANLSKRKTRTKQPLLTRALRLEETDTLAVA